MRKDDFFAKWSSLHGNTQISGVVRGWLGISYQCARFLTFLRVTPNLLTFLGVLFASLMLLKPFSLFAIALLMLSLLADGVDGSVAILQRRESNWGATIDSVADRASEALWLLVVYQIGVPAWLALSLWICAATQEYARARAASLGHFVIDVVTPTERPVRASVIFIILVGAQLNISGITSAAFILLAAQLVSLLLVMQNAYKKLK